MLYSAQRVRAKTRAAVKRREDQVEQEETEGGELNLIPYLDMVTNLMLFILASVSAGLILVQIDTTLPDKKAPSATPTPPSDKPPDEQPLELFLSVKLDSVILWSITGLEGTLAAPKATFPRTGRDGSPCDGHYMCESDLCGPALTCLPNLATDPAPVFDYLAINKALVEIANRRYAGKMRKADTYHATIQADPAIPYATIVAIMSSMRCALPASTVEAKACSVPNEDKDFKDSKLTISADKKYYNTELQAYDAKTMALFHQIRFSSGFEK